VREPWDLEPHGRTYHWSVYDVVKFEFGFAGTLRIVCRQGPPGCRGSHRPASCGCQLPAMRIGYQRRIRRRRSTISWPGQLLPHTCRDEGIDPIDRAGFAIARLPCTVIRKGPLGGTVPLTLAEISASWSRCSFRGSFQRTVNRGSFNGPPSSEPSSSGMLITPKALFSIVVVLTGLGSAVAQSNPRPPCGDSQPIPEYSKPGAKPNFHVWRESDRWTPPSCLGWTQKEGTLVAIAGQFHYRGNADGLLSRFGAVSTLAGLQYWSIRESGWRTLITNAGALDGRDSHRPRGDFSLDEMKSGADLYFTETDNRTALQIVYRMRVEATPSSLAISIENVTPVRQLLFTLLDPGDLQSKHFFAQAGANTWTYYGLARTGAVSSFLEVNEESYVNRALALYSHFTGTPVPPILRSEHD